jgi:hypothetical protein
VSGPSETVDATVLEVRAASDTIIEVAADSDTEVLVLAASDTILELEGTTS